MLIFWVLITEECQYQKRKGKMDIKILYINESQFCVDDFPLRS